MLSLLPTGQAWPRAPDSTLVLTITGLAYFYGFVDGRAADLLERESDPRKTIELLPDWEKAWGLPDPCFPPGNKIVEEFGDNVLSDEWDVLNNATVETGDYFRLREDATDGTHYTKQNFTALPVGKYRVEISWRPVGSAPRGMMLSVESFDSGANIWVKADGTINELETTFWGRGVTISGWKNAVVGDYQRAEYTINVTKPDTFVTCGLYLVNEDDVDTYPGLEDGTGIEFRHQSLRTVKQTEVPITSTIAERQKMLVLYMTWLGGQSRQYFIDLMEFIGYHVNYVGEFAPFMCGISEVGETRPTHIDENGERVLDTNKNFRWYIGPPEMRFSWFISVGQATLNWFRAASGQAGVDPHLTIGIPEDAQCLLNRWKPAHTFLAMDFSELAFGSPMAGTP